VLTRRRSRRQLTTLFVAAALVTLTAGAIALAGDRLRPSPDPSESAGPSQSGAPSAGPILVAGPGGVWIPVGSMSTPRAYSAAVRLLDGRVLVVGGSGAEFDPSTAELYDPASGTWSATGSMLAPGDGLPPTLLLDGRVLAGDQVDGHYGQGDFYGHELYDPAIGTWTATGRMVGDAYTFGDKPTVLRDGRVLALGQGRAQVYDPASGAWTATAPRTNDDKGAGGSFVLLSDGKVLLAGGYDFTLGGDPDSALTDVAEVYDPVTGSWAEVARMQEPALGLMATLLPDGTALVVTRSGAWQTYDPATGTWTAVPRPSGFNAASVMLSDGTVLMSESDESCTAAALYDPRTASLTAAASMLRCAEGSSFTLLLDGTVLLTGGRNCNSEHTVCVSNATAALYVPAGVPMPALPAFPGPLPPVLPDPTPVPTPLPPTAGPVPPNARSWTVTVENQGSELAALFVGDLGASGIEVLVGSATPNVVPAGTTVQVTFLFPAIDDGWIYVNPRPGDGGALVNADQIGIPGKIVIGPDGRAGWVSP
jgi:hypothetical protein